MGNNDRLDYGTFEAALEKSKILEADLEKHPEKYRVLTGDRPTAAFISGTCSVLCKTGSGCSSLAFKLTS